MDMFSALAEPHRRNILEMLASDGPLSATAISHRFRVSPPAISQHLKILREASLVTMQKRAQQRIYQINTDTMLELEHWARRMAAQQERRFLALERILQAQEQKTSKLSRKKEKPYGSATQGPKGSQRRKDSADR